MATNIFPSSISHIDFNYVAVILVDRTTSFQLLLINGLNCHVSYLLYQVLTAKVVRKWNRVTERRVVFYDARNGDGDGDGGFSAGFQIGM